MKAEEYYRNVDPLWCYGDIVRNVPHIHLRPPLPLRIIREESTKWGMRLTPYEYGLSVPQGGLKITQPEGEQVLASCQVALGMILTHGCEMDKDPKHRQVALIRPLGLVQPEHQGFIRENKNFSYCYLPAYGEIMGESYVDFRRVTTVHPDLLKDLERIVSLTDEAVNAVQTLLIRFTTRRDIKLDALD